jgi:Bacterial Ig-like domain (group 2)
VIRSALLISLLLVLGCSDLTEGAGGVVSLEITQPAFTTIETGETLALSARALDKNGNPVDAAVTWAAADPTLTVDPATGVVTGVSPGTGRVQAFAGNLASGLLQFTVIARADTLILTDSVFTVAPDAASSPPLVAQLQSFNPPGVLPDRPIVYEVTSPPDLGGPHTVELPGGVLIDTVNTGTDGAVSSVTLNRAGTLGQPDTAIVEVRAFRSRGALVPGSGQRFIVLFQ